LHFGSWHQQLNGLDRESGAERKSQPRIHEVSARPGFSTFRLQVSRSAGIRLEDGRMTSVRSSHVLSKTAGARVSSFLVELKLNFLTANRGFPGKVAGAGIDGVKTRFRIAGRLCPPANLDFGLSLCPARRVRSGDRHSVASTGGPAATFRGGRRSLRAGRPMSASAQGD
jgi:hypothetical protein